MSERPTPETDMFAVKFKSVCGSKAWVPTDICRRFERERDEAREQWKQQNEALITLALHGDAAIQRLTKERDEARAQLHIAVGLLSTHPQFEDKHPEEVLEFVKEAMK